MNKIEDKTYVRETCKLGKREECCAYLAMSSDGWACVKNTELASQIELRLANGTMNAKGDNCAGIASTPVDEKYIRPRENWDDTSRITT